jgi:Na+/melibiose symporter-like transporter
MGGIQELIAIAAMVIVVFFPLARIFRKAGYTGWLCLAVCIPLVGVIVLFWFAFATWPIEAQLARLRGQQGIEPKG